MTDIDDDCDDVTGTDCDAMAEKYCCMFDEDCHEIALLLAYSSECKTGVERYSGTAVQWGIQSLPTVPLQERRRYSGLCLLKITARFIFSQHSHRHGMLRGAIEV